MISVAWIQLPDWDRQKASTLPRLLPVSRAPDSLFQKHCLLLRNHSSFMLSTPTFFGFQNLPLCPLPSPPFCLGHLVTTGKIYVILVITLLFWPEIQIWVCLLTLSFKDNCLIRSSCLLPRFTFYNLWPPLPCLWRPWIELSIGIWHKSNQIHWLASNGWHHIMLWRE